MRRAFAILPLLVVAAGAPLAAQTFVTGTTGVIGSQDGTWSVSCASTGGGDAACDGSTTSPFIVNSVSGVWQQNGGAGNANWVSYWNGSTASDGQGDYNEVTNTGHRYTYTYTYTFAAGSGDALDLTTGWDNMFNSLTLNGNSVDLQGDLVSSGTLGDVDAKFGFCRDADGIFPTSDGPNACAANFVIGGVNPNADNTLVFTIFGDGETDGLWVNGDVFSTTQSVTPEPGTMALMATGLVGMAGASFRRRRRNK